jgi:hypothetical protein
MKIETGPLLLFIKGIEGRSKLQLNAGLNKERNQAYLECCQIIRDQIGMEVTIERTRNDLSRRQARYRAEVPTEAKERPSKTEDNISVSWVGSTREI